MQFESLAYIVVSTGFEGIHAGISAHLEIEGTDGILPGSQLESILLERDTHSLFSAPPKSVAFLQCFGSRDEREQAAYCSRVCCGYSTRAARVIRQYYPDCEISFFYMELQAVANADTLQELAGLGMRFIACRPVSIRGGRPVQIRYDDPKDGFRTEAFDLVVLSEGIHPPKAAYRLAECYGFSQDRYGFLQPVENNGATGIYLAGCARAPLRIEEAYADGMAAANSILAACTGQPAKEAGG